MDSLPGPLSPFYVTKFGGVTPGRLIDAPYTTKAELVADQAAHPPYGSVLTRPLADYTRMHQTSGTTTGRPLVWLDTAESWRWLLDRWSLIYDLAQVGPGDRLFFAFSFGPFLGFWTAFESAQSRCLCITGGGMSSPGRLRHLIEHGATVVLCTPTYALHLAEVAAQESIDLPGSAVSKLIVAGEPGGLIPATRARIESAWGARVFDHYGLTEVGPVAAESVDDPTAMIIVDGYVAESIDPQSLAPSPPGQVGELVLTNPGRVGSPLIRYRTGDLVRLDGRRLVGGILGRVDDMLHIRGNNIYPAAIESLVHRFHEIAEFRVEVDLRASLAEMTIILEPSPAADANELCRRLEQTCRDELLFRPTVVSVTPGSLPRSEMKSRRWSVRR